MASRSEREGWPLRKVVGQVEKPYDRDDTGKVLTVKMDVLECGHESTRYRRPTYVTGTGHDESADNASVRRCPTCPREETR